MILADALKLVSIQGPLAERLFAIHDPREAWEVMATEGRIPSAWADDPGRGFSCERCDGTLFRGNGCLTCQDARVLAYPTDLNSIANLVARLDDFTRVEALVHETVEELRRRHIPKVQPLKRIVWRRMAATPNFNSRSARWLLNTVGDGPRHMQIYPNGDVYTSPNRAGRSRAEWTLRPRLCVKPLRAIADLGFTVDAMARGEVRVQWTPL